MYSIIDKTHSLSNVYSYGKIQLFACRYLFTYNILPTTAIRAVLRTQTYLYMKKSIIMSVRPILYIHICTLLVSYINIIIIRVLHIIVLSVREIVFCIAALFVVHIIVVYCKNEL